MRPPPAAAALVARPPAPPCGLRLALVWGWGWGQYTLQYTVSIHYTLYTIHYIPRAGWSAGRLAVLAAVEDCGDEVADGGASRGGDGGVLQGGDSSGREGVPWRRPAGSRSPGSGPGTRPDTRCWWSSAGSGSAATEPGRGGRGLD